MLDETKAEQKLFNKLKNMCKLLSDLWKAPLSDMTEKGAKKDAGAKDEKVEFPKRLTVSPAFVDTSQS